MTPEALNAHLAAHLDVIFSEMREMVRVAAKALEQEVHPQVVHGQLAEAFGAIDNVLNDIEKELFQ